MCDAVDDGFNVRKEVPLIFHLRKFVVSENVAYEAWGSGRLLLDFDITLGLSIGSLARMSK